MSKFCELWIIISTVSFKISEVLDYEIDSGICGLRKIASPRIVGGSQAARGSWPWQVLIMKGGAPLCGGVLISSEHIITAAHCIPPNATSLLTFHLGAHRYDASDSTAVKVDVDNITCHRDYNDSTLQFDLCLAKLVKPTGFTNYIQPVCLPAKGTKVGIEERVTVTGWGDTLGTGRNEFLNEAEVFVIDTTVCERWYRRQRIAIPENHFCAGYQEGGIDSCYGDSGGPLVHKEMSSHNTTAFVLRGITSFGDGCAGKEKPGVYVRVSDLVSWIYETIEVLSPEMTHPDSTVISTSTTSEEQFTSTTGDAGIITGFAWLSIGLPFYVIYSINFLFN